LTPPRRFAILTRADREPSPAIAAHLKAQLHRMPPRGHRNPWWLPPETITMSLDQPSLMVPRIARRIRVITLPPGVMPLNHNLSLVRSTGAYDLDALRRILLSPASHRFAMQHCARLEDNFISLTTTKLRRLPIPAGAPGDPRPGCHGQ
jgi:hypothetical protein